MDENAQLLLTQLEQRVSHLEQRLSESTVRRAMRDCLTCAACGQGTILHITELLAHGLPVRVDNAGSFLPEPVGRLELFVCAACGYGEAQIDPSELTATERRNVRVLSRPAGPGERAPYR